MKNILLILLLNLAFTATTIHAEKESSPIKGPTLTQYGPNFAVKNRDSKLPKDFTYKAVFDISKTPDNKNQHNRSIESLARFINMHTRNGVKPENIKLAAVFHGSATKNTLSNTAYKKRYGVDNPNLELINQLSELGVDFYLCGQSAGFGNIDKSELNNNVKLALSAMTMFVVLQEQGYRLIP